MAKGDLGGGISGVGSGPARWGNTLLSNSAGSALASGPSRLFRPTMGNVMPQQNMQFGNGIITPSNGSFHSPMGNIGFAQGTNAPGMPQSPMMPSQNVWANILQKMMNSQQPQNGNMYGLFNRSPLLGGPVGNTNAPSNTGMTWM